MSLSQEDFFDDYFADFPIEPTGRNIEIVRAFCLEKWKKRHIEYGFPSDVTPVDLSGSCKFTALLGSVVFEADIVGNFDHVYNVLDGRVLDMNSGTADVLALQEPYRHDDAFIDSEAFRDSMETCADRVARWVRELASTLRESPAIDPASVQFGP